MKTIEYSRSVCIRGNQLSKEKKAPLAESAANGVLVLLAVACSLLDRQIAAQAEAFQREGGFTERLYRARMKARGVESQK